MKKWTLFTCCLLLFSSIYAQQLSDELFKVRVEGQGPPLLLIPGLGCSGEVWKETVAELSSAYECHIFTLAGFAGTPAFPGADTMFLPKIKKGLLQYIDEYNLEKPIIIGHSLGGFLALSIAADYPELTDKIIIVDSYPFYSAANNPSMTEDLARSQAEMSKTMMMNQSDSIFQVLQKQSIPTMVGKDHQEKVLDWSLRSDRATVAQAMFELMTTDLRQETARVKCPILVLGSWYAGKEYGMTKKIIAQIFDQQFQQATDYKLSMADTARHFIMLDDFSWFIKEVNAFLE